MKHIILLTLSIVVALTSCQSERAALPGHLEEVRANQAAVQMEVPQTAQLAGYNEPIEATEVVENLQEALLGDIKQQYKHCKAGYKKAAEGQKHYEGQIEVSGFEGKVVREAALELFRQNDLMHIHIDYLEGMPIGCKRFLVSHNQLIAVEIVRLKEATTENGTEIVEQLAQIYYYNNKELIQATDLLTNETWESSSKYWNEENLKDWQGIQQYL